MSTKLNEKISRIFREAFEAHPQRTTDYGVAICDARDDASRAVPPGITGTFDDETLTFTADRSWDADTGRGVKIAFFSSRDWGCEHTEADSDAYCAAVLAAIEHAYPKATISVEERSGHSRAYVDITASEPFAADVLAAEEDIKRTVEGIAGDIWAAGDFWPEEQVL